MSRVQASTQNCLLAQPLARAKTSVGGTSESRSGVFWGSILRTLSKEPETFRRSSLTFWIACLITRGSGQRRGLDFALDLVLESQDTVGADYDAHGVAREVLIVRCSHCRVPTPSVPPMPWQKLPARSSNTLCRLTKLGVGSEQPTNSGVIAPLSSAPSHESQGSDSYLLGLQLVMQPRWGSQWDHEILISISISKGGPGTSRSCSSRSSEEVEDLSMWEKE